MTITRSLLVTSITAMLSTAGLAADGQTPGSRTGARAVQAVSYCGLLPRTKVAQSNAGQSTSSNAFVDVIGASLGINIAGTANTCVLVEFNAQVYAPGAGKVMHVKAFLDGATESIEGQIQLQAESVTYSDARSYAFFFPNVPPGAHNIKMKYNSFPGGTNTVHINEFSMVVHYR
jgi:hypothetical protein